MKLRDLSLSNVFKFSIKDLMLNINKAFNERIQILSCHIPKNLQKIYILDLKLFYTI